MLTQLAALGIGLITTIGAPAIAQADCAPARPTAFPGYRAPTYAPAPQYNRNDAPHPVALRRADYNRDGGVSFREAQSYGRNEFRHADRDGNGVLTRYEIQTGDTLAHGARGRDGAVTFAEYDASIRRQFASLDRNRDGFVSRNELDSRPNGRTYSWHWQL